MLEKIDLSKTIKKDEYKQLMPVLRDELYAMQKASGMRGFRSSLFLRAGMRPGKAPPFKR